MKLADNTQPPRPKLGYKTVCGMIDFTELKKQSAALEEVIKIATPEQASLLKGLLNLVETLSDINYHNKTK